MTNSLKLWFSIYDIKGTYIGNEPEFLNPENFVWAKDFSENCNAIKKELNEYLTEQNLETYFRSSMVSQKNSWKTIALKNWSIEIFKNQKYFPITNSLLIKYPQIISTSFNLLTANSRIHLHSGDTNAIYRCHLGIDVPEGLPNCGFKVKNEIQSWSNGEWLVFMDAYEHEAWNNSSSDRYIFVIDVLRDEYVSKKNLVTSTVKTSLFLQKRAEKFKFIYNLNQSIISFIAKMLRPFILSGIRLCNILKIY